MIEKLNTLFPYLFFLCSCFCFVKRCFSNFYFCFFFFFIRTGWVNTFDLILCRIFYCAKWFFLYIYVHYIAYCIYTCVSTHVVKLCSTWHRLWYFFFFNLSIFYYGNKLVTYCYTYSMKL